MNYRRACDILLIDQGSISLEVIRKQYKLLALKYHPDKNAAENAADMYRVIKDAHDYLIDGISEATGSEATGSEATGSEDLDLDEDFDDNDLDEDTFFFQALDVVELNVGEDEIISITFRN